MSVVQVSKRSVKGFVALNGTIQATGVEQPLAGDLTFSILKGIVIRADSGNSADILFGAPSYAATGFRLHAGDVSPVIPIDHTDGLTIVGTLGDAYSWFKV